MNIAREKLRCLPLAGLAYFGGDSASTSSTTNNTEVRDMRVVGGEGSNNVSANDSTVLISSTDHGAVSGAFGAIDSVTKNAFGGIQGALNTADKTFALSTELVSDSTKDILTFGKSLFDGALGTVNSANSAALGAVSSARQDVADAYSNAVTPENGMLKIAGFVVVGIAAVSLLAGKFK